MEDDSRSGKGAMRKGVEELLRRKEKMAAGTEAGMHEEVAGLEKKGVLGDAEKGTEEVGDGDEVENKERGLVLLGGGGGDIHGEDEAEEEEEEEYVFEEEDETVQTPAGWMAIARYYSGQEFKTWVLFNDLSKVWGKTQALPVRDLGDNRFLVEFDSEWLWKKAIRGGPWTFRGDAVIFVAYDGLQRFSKVEIESIALWVRIFDLPVKMMVDSCVRMLAKKIGRVLEIGEARMDYKRVRVKLPLAKAIAPTVSIKVKDHGVMVFAVKYEGIPHFYFVCGRIGHAARECPEENNGDGGVQFGTSLRCSPHKREAGRKLTIPAVEMKAKKGLHFSGDQKEKVMSMALSSTTRLRGGGGGRQVAARVVVVRGRQEEVWMERAWMRQGWLQAWQACRLMAKTLALAKGRRLVELVESLGSTPLWIRVMNLNRPQEMIELILACMIAY